MKKLRLCIILLVLPFILISLSDDLLIVKAIGKAPSNITPESKARVMALRAAKVEGYRKLARMAGIERITKQGSKEYREIQAFLQKAQVKDSRFISDYEAEVTMTIRLSQVIDKISKIRSYQFDTTLISKLKKKIETMEKRVSTLNQELEELKKILMKLEEKAK